MTLPTDLVRRVRALDEAQLRRLLILARGLLVGSPGPVVEPADVPGVPAARYVQKRVRCGKACARCPHGPYWYATWREDGRSRSLYLGRELPADVRRIVEEARRARPAAVAVDASTQIAEVRALPDRRGGEPGTSTTAREI